MCDLSNFDILSGVNILDLHQQRMLLKLQNEKEDQCLRILRRYANCQIPVLNFCPSNHVYALTFS